MLKIAFLQNIGVPRDAVAAMMSALNRPYELHWNDGPVDLFATDASILVTVNAVVDDKVLSKCPRLELVAVAFTGHDHVSKDLCAQRGIKVCNVPAYSTDSVAELTLGLAIGLVRNIPLGDRAIRTGGWTATGARMDWSNRPPMSVAQGTELAGKMVGIIGTGTIGMRVAELFAALKCRLVGCARTARPRFEELGGVYRTDAASVCAEADIVTVHVALNEKTRRLIGEREIASMKPTACLINTSRGPVVDQSALTVALQESRIRGAALDVFDVEPLSAGDALAALPNVILTPHIGYNTQEALDRRAHVTMLNIRAFLEGRDENRVA